MIQKQFSENLQYYRKYKGLTQKQLASATGVTQVAIANYEKGNRFPSEDQLRNISQKLGVSLDILLSIHFSDESDNKKESRNLEEFIDIIQNESSKRSREYLDSWRVLENYKLADLFNEILIPILVKTGELWKIGVITAAEEHIISEKVRELIYVSSLKYSQNQSQKQSSVWLGLCAPGEDHDLALLMNACLLRESGWKVINMGINVPLLDITKIIKNSSVDVVNFSISRSIHNNSLRMALDVLQKEFSEKITVIISGSGADQSLTEEFKIVKSVCRSLEESVDMAKACIK